MDRRSFVKIFALTVATFGTVSPENVLAATDSSPRLSMLIDLRRCVGCQSCVVSCGAENNTSIGSFRTTVGEYYLSTDGSEANSSIAPLPRMCNHCKTPSCTPVCPVTATYVESNGRVVINYDDCIGCGFCIQSCPYDARFFNHETETADKCNLCSRRTANNLLPACVENCLGGARMYGDLNDPDSLIHKKIQADLGQLRVLYPKKNTDPCVYYIGLDSFFEDSKNIGEPRVSSREVL